ncbi:ABC transporter ATP-binding protein [Anaerosinus massiliensis]|uniref:ABC transporter ATP-binding protein n=1 Tax=Massilibacillus massiliensis TaxID=1806837 RepID=UPI000AAF5638|nr:ABC transporter ATP-binding protein [Massilibacillus massiliensis]
MNLTLQDVDVTIEKIKIVKNVSLAVHKGEFVGMIGPNGSGKSTLLKAVYRVLKPSHGTILFGGENMQDIPLHTSAKQLGVVGQFNTVNFDFTVLEMVLMGRTPHKKTFSVDTQADYKLALQALTHVGMQDAVNRQFVTLSGGEKQRIILARALVQQPKFLVLDEPTNHLDIKYQLQLLSIVKSLGIGTLAALHDLNLAAMYCTKLFVLKNGCLIAEGTPQEVLTKERIRDIYEIDCDVNIDRKTGVPSIVYQPIFSVADTQWGDAG